LVAVESGDVDTYSLPRVSPMKKLLIVLALSFPHASLSAEPTPAQVEQRLREIALEYRAMEAELKAAQLTIQNLQLRAPQLRAEEEQLKKLGEQKKAK
jgi:hypothetical protein